MIRYETEHHDHHDAGLMSADEYEDRLAVLPYLREAAEVAERARDPEMARAIRQRIGELLDPIDADAAERRRRGLRRGDSADAEPVLPARQVFAREEWARLQAEQAADEAHRQRHQRRGGGSAEPTSYRGSYRVRVK